MDYKKILGLVLVVVLIVGVTLGIVFGVKGCNNNTSGEIATQSSVSFDDTQSTSNAYIRAWAVSKDELTKITYQIDTLDEVSFSTKLKGAVDEDWKYYDKDFKKLKYIDSGDKLIDISNLNEGKHTISIYIYNEDDECECIYESIFRVKK